MRTFWPADARAYIRGLGLTDDAIAKRASSIGGSDANRLMQGKWKEVWLKKTGRATGDDLSGVLRVQMGHQTEQLNRAWYCTQKDLALAILDEPVAHPKVEWATASFDGFALKGTPIAVVECKHTAGYTTHEQLLERYYPQIQHYLWVANMTDAHLSVIFGNDKWEVLEVVRDEDYLKELIQVEKTFWRHVQNDVEPDDLAAIATKAKIPVTATKIVAFKDLKEANAIAALAETWLKHRDAVKAFDEAESGIKGVIPPDAAVAHGFGLICTRNKKGALTMLPLDQKLAKKHKLPEAA